MLARYLQFLISMKGKEVEVYVFLPYVLLSNGTIIETLNKFNQTMPMLNLLKQQWTIPSLLVLLYHHLSSSGRIMTDFRFHTVKTVVVVEEE